jgi:ergothioneine biosynthesis protein EgtB
MARTVPQPVHDPDDPPVKSSFGRVRALTTQLCAPLEPEDFVVQTMPDVSPAKWHLAHTTWFFETFVLARFVRGYQPFDSDWGYLFNSYYESVGERWPRAQRGFLSRPTVREVFAYRTAIDEQVEALLESPTSGDDPELRDLVTLGLHHEEQHQELLLTDIKHVLGTNPLRPAYHARPHAPSGVAPALEWVSCDGGEAAIGHTGAAFAFDNERPRHCVLLPPYRLASRPVTNGEYLAFVEDAGYRRADCWLSDGWSTVQQEGWEAPLYWARGEDGWMQTTLRGRAPLDPHEPVCHVSYFEADAFARWAGMRLPREAEWEALAAGVPVGGNLLENGRLHPHAAPEGEGLRQMYGDVWEWTASPYVGYPGFRPAAGAVGEYNGKFMCNQMVLRGGSCVTPAGHIRATYRNFFPLNARWQFTGIRLADEG